MPPKNTLVTYTAIATCLLATISFVLGQTATFTFDDGTPPGATGSYPAGAHFTFSINLMFASGGNINNVAGVSYYFQQHTQTAPFYFAITDRDVTGSQFTFLQTPSLTYPQNLAPANPNDLGAGTESGSGLGGGTYLVAKLTVSIDPFTAPGTYLIENTTVVPKRSVIADDLGHTFGIAQTSYTINVVPFQFTSITRPDSDHTFLQGKAVPNTLTKIEASLDPSSNSFQPLTSVMTDSDGAFSYTDAFSGAQRFYRLVYP